LFLSKLILAVTYLAVIKLINLFVCFRDLYIPSQAYAQSKLAQILFTSAVDRKLREKNLPVLIFSLHPGIVNTELFNGTTLKKLIPFAPALFFKVSIF